MNRRTSKETVDMSGSQPARVSTLALSLPAHGLCCPCVGQPRIQVALKDVRAATDRPPNSPLGVVLTGHQAFHYRDDREAIPETYPRPKPLPGGRSVSRFMRMIVEANDVALMDHDRSRSCTHIGINGLGGGLGITGDLMDQPMTNRPPCQICNAIIRPMMLAARAVVCRNSHLECSLPLVLGLRVSVQSWNR
jgi:hypothetical protein